MPIHSIDTLTFGVDDIATSVRFFTDAGLELQADGTSLMTAARQTVALKLLEDPSLPPAIEPGPTLREITWAVSEADDLRRFAEAVPGARMGDDGILRCSDPTGMAVAFKVAERVVVEPDVRDPNQLGHWGRVNDRLGPRGAPRSLRILHVMLNITKALREEANAFYTGPLCFKEVDVILDTGTFLQAEGDFEHHNYFLCHRPDKLGMNHFALEVADFDAVMEGGNYMLSQGWSESRRPGRHVIGSNAYRFIHAPCGGRIEFVADMDRMDKSWETRTFEKNPGHHIWTLKVAPSPVGDGDDRRD